MDFPAGVSYHTGRTAVLRRSLEDKLTGLLMAEGFEEVITPVFEFHDAAAQRAGGERVYRFPDQLTGRMLALRWDFTVQIAQLAAVRPGKGGARHWFYRGNVFRPIREHAGEKRQIYQVGAELVGDSSAASTAVMMRLAVKLAAAAGLGDCVLVVGHVGFVERLMSAMGLPPAEEQHFLDVLQRKDLSGLAIMARRLSLDPGKVELVRRAMYLMGGGEILEEAGRIIGAGRADGILDELRSVRGADSEAGGLLYDLTEPRGFDYYTGIMFQIVARGSGQEVCRGGRYDNLVGQFGRPAPAVGFALDLENMLLALEGSAEEAAENE